MLIAVSPEPIGRGITTRAVGGQRARLLGTFYIVTFLSLSHII